MQAEAEEVNKDALWGLRWLHLSVISLCEYAECAGGKKTHTHIRTHTGLCLRARPPPPVWQMRRRANRGHSCLTAGLQKRVLCLCRYPWLLPALPSALWSLDSRLYFSVFIRTSVCRFEAFFFLFLSFLVPPRPPSWGETQCDFQPPLRLKWLCIV